MYENTDRLKCTVNGVEGYFLRSYVVTGAGVNIMVKTDDGRSYYAPANCWIKVN